MIKKAKGIKGKCDTLFRKIVRSLGYCQRCGSTSFLQCAHIISRRYSAVRTDLRNAWCLCASCHRRLTDWPNEHMAYVAETIGIELYDELKQKAEFTMKFDWEQEYIRLRNLVQ